MAQYIDKDAVVAEIERLQDAIKATAIDGRISKEQAEAYKVCVKLRSFVEDTLEAKEMDLQKEIDRVWDNTSDNFSEDGWKEFEDIAKHFFELGLMASNPLTWEDVKEICVQSVLVEIDLGGKVSDERHYSEVLKRFKAQKGEKL